MRFRIILPALLAMTAITSCSVYRSAQTPDDVYFSPGRTEDSYLTVDNTKRGSRYDNTNPDDNYLRMKQYGSRWNSFDSYNDWQYNGGYYGMYSPYTPYSSFYGPSIYGGYGGFYGGYGIGMPYAYGYNPWSYGSYWNSYYYWNSFYNPYSSGIYVGGIKSNPVVYQSVRSFNPGSYTNRNYNNRNINNGRSIYNANPNGRYSTTNNNNSYNSGGLHRYSNDRYYTPTQPQRSSIPTYSPPSSPVRTYSPSSSGGSSGGGGGRPVRGH